MEQPVGTYVRCKHNRRGEYDPWRYYMRPRPRVNVDELEICFETLDGHTHYGYYDQGRWHQYAEGVRGYSWTVSPKLVYRWMPMSRAHALGW